MSIHIGSIVHKIIEEKGIKGSLVAQKCHMSVSNLYKLYKKETVDIEVLIRLSEVLETNLFLSYFEKEPFNQMFCQESSNLKKEVNQLQSIVDLKNDKISDLTQIVSYQKQLIENLEKNS